MFLLKKVSPRGLKIPTIAKEDKKKIQEQEEAKVEQSPAFKIQRANNLTALGIKKRKKEREK